MTKQEITPRVESWINTLNEMIESGEYVFAEEFLMDVREQCEEKGEITKNQTAAILNIRRSIQ